MIQIINQNIYLFNNQLLSFESELVNKINFKCKNLGLNGDKYFINICQSLDLDNTKAINLKKFKKLIEKIGFKIEEDSINLIFSELSNNNPNFMLNYHEYASDLFYSKKKIKQKLKEKVLFKNSSLNFNLERMHKAIKTSNNLILLYYSFVKSEVSELERTGVITGKYFNTNNNNISKNYKKFGVKIIKPFVFDFLQGKVSVDDFIFCVIECKLQMSIQEIQKIFRLYDENNTGKFSYIALFADLTVRFFFKFLNFRKKLLLPLIVLFYLN
jgi:Ca2+-binding EF-hand superfamily protein